MHQLHPQTHLMHHAPGGGRGPQPDLARGRAAHHLPGMHISRAWRLRRNRNWRRPLRRRRHRRRRELCRAALCVAKGFDPVGDVEHQGTAVVRLDERRLHLIEHRLDPFAHRGAMAVRRRALPRLPMFGVFAAAGDDGQSLRRRGGGVAGGGVAAGILVGSEPLEQRRLHVGEPPEHGLLRRADREAVQVEVVRRAVALQARVRARLARGGEDARAVLARRAGRHGVEDGVVRQRGVLARGDPTAPEVGRLPRGARRDGEQQPRVQLRRGIPLARLAARDQRLAVAVLARRQPARAELVHELERAPPLVAGVGGGHRSAVHDRVGLQAMLREGVVEERERALPAATAQERGHRARSHHDGRCDLGTLHGIEQRGRLVRLA
eukprot:scaffold73161_cov63-Phaeocystis_antarctica.AAC.1